MLVVMLWLQNQAWPQNLFLMKALLAAQLLFFVFAACAYTYMYVNKKSLHKKMFNATYYSSASINPKNYSYKN